MKKLYIVLTLILPLHLYGQTYNMPTGSGVSGSTSTCSGTFRDNGGGGNYSNNQNSFYTIRPGVAGQYVRVNFTSFNTENGFDYLIIFDGDTPIAPIIGIYTGGASPGTITASNPTGALSFRFYSDGSVRRPGWNATISCQVAPGPPNPGSVQDCGGGGGITICDNSSFSGNSNGFDNQELFPPWDGCLNREHESSWYYFSPSSAGTVEFTIAPSVPTDDYDFAIWGPYSSVECPSYTSDPPIRCSYSALSGNTGLRIGSGDVSEDWTGDKWVDELNVAAGEVYVMVIDNWSATTNPFDFNWNLTGGASLDCTPLPIVLIEFDAETAGNENYIHWATAVEINNDYFTLEKSPDGEYWTELGRIPGAGNSNEILNYGFYDPSPYGITYYRLTQTDYDKKSETFKIISVTREKTGAEPNHIFNFYPNPSRGIVNVETYTSGDHELFIADETGRVRISKMLSGSVKYPLDLSELPPGLYTIGIKNELGTSYQKLIRQ